MSLGLGRADEAVDEGDGLGEAVEGISAAERLAVAGPIREGTECQFDFSGGEEHGRNEKPRCLGGRSVRDRNMGQG